MSQYQKYREDSHELDKAKYVDYTGPIATQRQKKAMP